MRSTGCAPEAADFAVLDIHDLALARERGRDLVGVMAFVQTPLTAVPPRRRIRTPRELEGRRIGISGRAGDDAGPARDRPWRRRCSGEGAGREDRLRPRCAAC